MKLPPLRAVHYFESVARLLSFSKAAEELNVTQSAVSHQVRLLEEYLGEQLFVRQGRKLSLSQSGALYLEEITPAIYSISKASQKIREGEAGQIRLAIYSSLAVKWLIPRLSEFKRAHPEIELIPNMVANDTEFSDNIADCFITVAPPQKNFHIVPLVKEILYPLCSRTIWNELQDKKLPDAILELPLLSSESIYWEKGKDWQRWCEELGVDLPKDANMQYFSHMLLAIEAARYDQGVVLASEYMITERDLENDLVYIPSPGLVSGDTYYFMCKKSRVRQPEIIKLENWLKQQAMNTPGPNQ
ncbi:D-serine dehydratase transcriptional activator [Vibrio ishigakensis]|uniref:D-serine dehydratase transcriptional activator n=1 Tax=Vibrio ishigakensis TaxID=1481914 RepID=A0A0B8QDM7_9VIBR|nr:D-serine dehydratase transcriptional activator [Vibrio ishigakensis]